MPSTLKSSNRLLDLYQFRAAKLGSYADTLGRDNKLAKILGLSPVRLHRLIRSQDVPFSEKMARAIETRLGKPYGWLDSDIDMTSSVSNHSIPIYFLEDINDLNSRNETSLATPAGYQVFSTDIPNAYFVKITTNAYTPKIHPGDLVLVNPHEKILEPSNTYLISYLLNGAPLRAILRKFENNHLIDLITNETEDIQEYVIHGKCITLIKTVSL